VHEPETLQNAAVGRRAGLLPAGGLRALRAGAGGPPLCRLCSARVMFPTAWILALSHRPQQEQVNFRSALPYSCS
jgi:hypothetical protein